MVLTMARRGRTRPLVVVVGGLLVVGAALLVVKWLLITTAILAVPFGIWWLFDREKRKTAEWDAQRRPARPINPEHEAQMAELYDMPESAAFWRAQPPSELLPDEVEWRARVERDHQQRLREQS